MEDGGAVRSWCGHAGALVPVGGEDIEERGMSGVAADHPEKSCGHAVKSPWDDSPQMFRNGPMLQLERFEDARLEDPSDANSW